MTIRTVEMAQHVGERVVLHGWLHHVRKLGGVSFVLLRDGWGIVQIVAMHARELAPLSQLAQGSILQVEGVVVTEKQAVSGVELHSPTFTVLESIEAQPPLTLHKRSIKAALPTILNHAVVANRHPERQATFRLAAGVMAGFRETLNARHFTEVQTPKLVEAATEGGANVFGVDYFGRKAYLAQSPQFYKQIMVGVFERVYEVGPVFRAEPHNTSRHIAEYVSLDVEFGFIENHFTVMAMVEQVMRGIFAVLGERYSAEITRLNVNMPTIPAEGIPHLHFTEAQQLLWERYTVDLRNETDLSPEGERLLGRWALETHGSDLLFVTGYPMSKRPFYTHPDPARPAYSNSFDLLFRGLELITGGQRLHQYEQYQAALEAEGLPEQPFETYLEAFKHGMPRHGGFAIGLERLLVQLLEKPNIRLTTLFPRDIGRLSP